MKNKVFLLLGLAIVSVLPLHSQNPNLERLNAYKVAFFTKRISLTPQEAEKFWPVYNEYQEKKNLIQQERSVLLKNINLYAESMSEKELTESGDKYISLEMKEAELAVQYHARFSSFLSPGKVIRLYQAENQYRMQLLNELQDRRAVRNGVVQ